jgi:uncharacterized protein with FMN-binding domain
LPKRGALALVTTVLAVVLLFNFKPADPATALNGGGLAAGTLGTDPPVVAARPAQPTSTPLVAGPPAPTSRTGTTSRATTPPAQPGPTAPPAGNGGTGNNVSGTFTGKAIDTPYGTVQIALVVQNGRITDVQELQLPSDRRLSQQISAQAGPMLRDEVLQAQGDNINGVSGASYTSYGFYQSLQSALQQM